MRRDLRREIGISIAGPLGIVLLLNLFVLGFGGDFSPNLGYRLVLKKWKQLLHLKKPVDWLILGDSSGNQGVVPSLLNEELSVTSLNLCTVGGLTLANDAWMLETYLQKFGPPRGVLIVHFYETWGREMDQELMAKIPLPWGFWRRLDPSLELDGKSRFRIFLAKYLPLYTENKTLSLLFTAPRTYLGKKIHLQNDGFMKETAPDPPTVQSDAAGHLGRLRKHHFSISEINLKALDQIRSLAERHQFEVYFVESPLYEGLFRDPAFRKNFSGFQESLARTISGSRRLHYLSEIAVAFPIHQMQNIDHLTYEGAQTYTRRLSSQIAGLGKA